MIAIIDFNKNIYINKDSVLWKSREKKKTQNILFWEITVIPQTLMLLTIPET